MFLDKDDLHLGEQSWQKILQALTTARIVLVVISPGFQRSAWCLEELRIALLRPGTVRIVYWDMEPGDLDEPALAEAAEKYEGCSRLHDSPVPLAGLPVEVWRRALDEAAALTGKVHKKSSQCVWYRQCLLQQCDSHGCLAAENVRPLSAAVDYNCYAAQIIEEA